MHFNVASSAMSPVPDNEASPPSPMPMSNPGQSPYPSPRDFDPLHVRHARHHHLSLSHCSLAAMLFSRSPCTSIVQLATNICAMISEMVLELLFYAWVGLYCFISWFSVVTGQFWTLDIFTGRWGAYVWKQVLELSTLGLNSEEKGRQGCGSETQIARA